MLNKDSKELKSENKQITKYICMCIAEYLTQIVAID